MILLSWLFSIELGTSRRRSRAAAVHATSDERVVDTSTSRWFEAAGPYRRIRHPLYTATIGVFVGLGAVLGHWVSIAFAALPAWALAHRIGVEEVMLLGVPGLDYDAYRRRTQRLLPGVW